MMIRKLVTTRIALTLGISLTVLACTDDDIDGDGADDVEGTEGTQDADTGDDSDGDPGDGDGFDVVEQACTDACQLVEDCFFAVPECTQLCIESYVEATDECVEAQLATTMCVTSLSCQEYQALLNGEPGAPCTAESEASDACGG